MTLPSAHGLLPPDHLRRGAATVVKKAEATDTREEEQRETGESDQERYLELRKEGTRSCGRGFVALVWSTNAVNVERAGECGVMDLRGPHRCGWSGDRLNGLPVPIRHVVRRRCSERDERAAAALRCQCRGGCAHVRTAGDCPDRQEQQRGQAPQADHGFIVTAAGTPVNSQRASTPRSRS